MQTYNEQKQHKFLGASKNNKSGYARQTKCCWRRASMNKILIPYKQGKPRQVSSNQQNVHNWHYQALQRFLVAGYTNWAGEEGTRKSAEKKQKWYKQFSRRNCKKNPQLFAQLIQGMFENLCCKEVEENLTAFWVLL